MVRLLSEGDDGGLRAAVLAEVALLRQAEAAMRVIFIEQDAFVELVDGNSSYLVFIGKRDMVMAADNQQLVDMASRALAIAHYNSLATGNETIN